MKKFHLRLITGVLIGIGTLGLFFLPPWVGALAMFFILARILLVEWPRLFSPHDRFFWLLPLYPTFPIVLMIYMQLYGYTIHNLMTICIIAAHDTGAYLVGKYMGTTPLAPTISPQKTWEGFIGGCVLSCAFSLIFFSGNPVVLIIGCIFPLVVSLNFAALAGDLFESMLKRRAGLKDAGNVLPGHGGILDRIDGLLFAAPLVFLVRNWIRLLLA